MGHSRFPYIYIGLYTVYTGLIIWGGGGGLINKTKRQARQVLGATVNDRTFFNCVNAKMFGHLPLHPSSMLQVYIYTY